MEFQGTPRAKMPVEFQVTPLARPCFNFTSTPLTRTTSDMPSTPLHRGISNEIIPSTPHQRTALNFSVATPLTRTTSTSILEGSIHNDSNWQPCILEPFYHLPTIENPQTDSVAFRSITAETLSELLDLPKEEFDSKYILIDCRYPYEYNGGHIKYATNFHENDKTQDMFFPAKKEAFDEINKKIPIFYCEFSQVRGPKMAHALRRFDRKKNEQRYPFVDYEEMYLLDRGYNNFFKLFKNNGYCVPEHYVSMNCKSFTNHLKKFHFHRSRYQPFRKAKFPRMSPSCAKSHFKLVPLSFTPENSLSFDDST